MTDSIIERFIVELGKEFNERPELPKGDPAFTRLPVVFVIDHSDSTRLSGDIVQINEFLIRFADTVGSAQTPGWILIRQHLDLYIIGYNERASEILGWTPGDELSGAVMPTLAGSGRTSMGAGLELAASAMMRRLANYRARSLPCYRGYIFNVTDGNPTDMAPSDGDSATSQWTRVKKVLDSFETKSSTGTAYAQTFHMASRQANRELLRLLAYDPSRVIDLEQADFDRLFEFVRVSLLMTFE